MCLLNASTSPSQENICAQAASNQSYYFHRVGVCMTNSLDGFYMPFHAGLVASHIQLVAIEFRSYTATTKGSCSPFCRVCVCVCVCMLNVLITQPFFQWTVHVGRHMQFKVWQPVFNSSCWLETYDSTWLPPVSFPLVFHLLLLLSKSLSP